MVVLTTTRDQIRVGAAAKRAGGYDELVRLDREKRRAGKGAVLKRRPDGRLYYAADRQAPANPESMVVNPPFAPPEVRARKSLLRRLFSWWVSLRRS